MQESGMSRKWYVRHRIGGILHTECTSSVRTVGRCSPIQSQLPVTINTDSSVRCPAVSNTLRVSGNSGELKKNSGVLPQTRLKYYFNLTI